MSLSVASVLVLHTLCMLPIYLIHASASPSLYLSAKPSPLSFDMHSVRSRLCPPKRSSVPRMACCSSNTTVIACQDTALCVSGIRLRPFATLHFVQTLVPFRLFCFSEGWTGNKVSASGSGPMRHTTATITSSCHASHAFTQSRPNLPSLPRTGVLTRKGWTTLPRFSSLIVLRVLPTRFIQFPCN